MSEPIISVSGLRGLIGEQLTPLVASKYIAALATTLNLRSTLPSTQSSTSASDHNIVAPHRSRGLVVIGRDGRQSGQMLVQAISATLQAHGLDVIDLGPAATPTVGVQVRKLSAVAGIQVSASHNPKEYNGIKLFNSEGRVFPKKEGEEVLKAYRAGTTAWVGVESLGVKVEDHDPHTNHCARVLKTINAEVVQQKRFRVLLDSNHGAGGLLGRQLLEALGCDVTIIGDSPDGKFAHTPEPLAENLRTISAQARQAAADGTGYDVVFCQDPDADRLAVIDERGEFIGEELTVALCLMQMLPKINQQEAVIVINCATSGLAKHLATVHGCRCLQSAVGEANVADMMIAERAVFGGEGNGGPIDPEVGYVRDSFVGMARILELMATSGQTVSQLVAKLPPLAMVKDKAELDAALLPKLFEQLTESFSEAKVNRLDGLKLEWPDRWLLVRGSNTEPIVRFIAEAPTIAEAQHLCEQAQIMAKKLRTT